MNLDSLVPGRFIYHPEHFCISQIIYYHTGYEQPTLIKRTQGRSKKFRLNGLSYYNPFILMTRWQPDLVQASFKLDIPASHFNVNINGMVYNLATARPFRLLNIMSMIQDCVDISSIEAKQEYLIEDPLYHNFIVPGGIVRFSYKKEVREELQCVPVQIDHRTYRELWSISEFKKAMYEMRTHYLQSDYSSYQRKS